MNLRELPAPPAPSSQDRVKAAGSLLGQLDLHRPGHTFASIGIAAGLNAKTLKHLSRTRDDTITLDRYVT